MAKSKKRRLEIIIALFTVGKAALDSHQQQPPPLVSSSHTNSGRTSASVGGSGSSSSSSNNTTSASASSNILFHQPHSYNHNHNHTHRHQQTQTQTDASTTESRASPIFSRNRSLKRPRSTSSIYPAPNPIAPYCTVTSILWDPRYTTEGRPDFADYYKQHHPVPPPPTRIVDDTDDIDGIDEADDSFDEISDDGEEVDEDEDLYGDEEQEVAPRPTARPPQPKPQEKLKRARSRTRSRSRSVDTSTYKHKEIAEEGKVIENNKNSVMEKRHPSSFQQLEKLGEGTYATVKASLLVLFRIITDERHRCSKDETVKPGSWWH